MGSIWLRIRTSDGSIRLPKRVLSHVVTYSRINSTKSPDSSAGNVNKAGECAKSCARRSVFLQSERWRGQYSSAYVAAAIMRLR
jgi:hypothetical protein